MWYLPMLFWCFVGIYLIEKVHISSRLAMVLLIVLAVVGVVPMPFGLTSATYYMLFFYVGYCLKRYAVNTDRFVTKGNLLISSMAFLLLFVSGTCALKNGLLLQLIDGLNVMGGVKLLPPVDLY